MNNGNRSGGVVGVCVCVGGGSRGSVISCHLEKSQGPIFIESQSRQRIDCAFRDRPWAVY